MEARGGDGKGREDAGEARVLIGGEDEPARGRGELRGRRAAERFEPKVEAADIAEAGDGGQVEGEGLRLADRLRTALDLAEDVEGGDAARDAVAERLQQHDHE